VRVYHICFPLRYVGSVFYGTAGNKMIRLHYIAFILMVGVFLFSTRRDGYDAGPSLPVFALVM